MDKVKTISYAEGDSKLHSVERVHPAEHRGLSQNAIISSHAIYADEHDKYGFVDVNKMKRNMYAAADEAVSRIHGTPFAKSALHSCRTPDVNDWVFKPDVEDQIDSFFL